MIPGATGWYSMSRTSPEKAGGEQLDVSPRPVVQSSLGVVLPHDSAAAERYSHHHRGTGVVLWTALADAILGGTGQHSIGHSASPVRAPEVRAFFGSADG